MTDSNQARVAAGVPTGGQFAASAHAESGVSLAEPSMASILADALGPGDPIGDDTLTAQEQRILSILVDPDVNSDSGYADDFDSILEELAFNGEDGSYSGAEAIAERLVSHYRRQTGPDGVGSFDVDLHRSGAYDVESYAVSIGLGIDHGNTRLSETHDAKYLSTRPRYEGESGLRRAIRVAENIDNDYRRLLAKTRSLGLVPSPAPATREEARTQRIAAERASREQREQTANALLTEAAFLIREQYPDAAYVVLTSSVDEPHITYAHAILDADKKPLAYPESDGLDRDTGHLQGLVQEVDPSGSDAHDGEQWGDPDGHAWAVPLPVTPAPATQETR